MSQVFGLAKQFVAMEPDEIENLLDDQSHEVKVGAVSIMGQQATRKATSEARRKELFELYLRRSDRIDTWDLVDVSAHHVVGGYLFDKPRDVLYELACSAPCTSSARTIWTTRSGSPRSWSRTSTRWSRR